MNWILAGGQSGKGYQRRKVIAKERVCWEVVLCLTQLKSGCFTVGGIHNGHSIMRKLTDGVKKEH
jgi:hypothetical protein